MNGFAPLQTTIPVDANYHICGPDCQILAINLRPGESVIGEPGSMMFMSTDVKMSTVQTSCFRFCSGEACCKVQFTNNGGQEAYIGMIPSYPAKVIPIDLSAHGGRFIGKAGAYMSSLGQVDVGTNLDFGPTCCFGGLGFCRQEVTGTGTAFMNGGGTVSQRILKEGETLVIDANSVIGFQDSVKFSFKLAGGPLTLCFGGEGCCLNTMTGPGLVITESMSFAKFKANLAPPPPPESKGGDSNTES